MAQVKFMRVATRPTFVAANHDGVILFETSTQNLYMGKKEGWVLYSKVKDVRFNENKLEVTYDDDTWSTLLDLTSGSYTVPASKVTVADSGDKFTATDVEAALAELKDDIDSTGGAAKTYKIVEVASPASTSLKEYKVQVAVGSGSFADDTNSATIVVPKDQHLKSVSLENEDDKHTAGQFLKFTYVLNDGTESDVYVDVSTFLAQSEFGDGLEVSNAGVVSAKLGNGIEFGNEASGNKSLKVKIDSTSEKDSQATPVDFLTVGANGVKVQGIKDEIGRKIAALDVTTDAAVAGQYVAAIEETDGIVAVKTRANVSEAVLNNYAKGSDDAAVAATDTVNQAISKLENQVDAAKNAASAAHSVVAQAQGNTHVTVTASQPDATTGAITYTIGETNIADADDLATEITRAQNAEGEIAGKVGLTGTEGSRVWTPTTNYGGTTTNAQANMQAIDAAVKANADAIDKLKAKNVSIVEKNTDATADTNDKYIKVTKATDSSTSSDTYTVTTTGIDTALSGKKNVLTAVDKTVTDAAKIVTGVHQNTNGDITSIDEANVGTRLLTGYTLGNSVGVAATDTVNQAIGKLQYELTWIEA